MLSDKGAKLGSIAELTFENSHGASRPITHGGARLGMGMGGVFAPICPKHGI